MNKFNLSRLAGALISLAFIALLGAHLAFAEEAKNPASAPKGFILSFADGAYQLQTNIHFQEYYRADLGDNFTGDGFGMRRFRTGFKAVLNKNYEARMLTDFAGDKVQLLDAWLATSLCDKIRLQMGKMKPPFALERLQPTQSINFLELGFTSALSPDRDAGVQISGSPIKGLELQGGAFNGTGDGASGEVNNDDKVDLVGRLWWTPIAQKDGANIGLGGAATYGKRKADANLTKIKSPGGRTLFKYASSDTARGELVRWQGGLYGTFNHASLLGEYNSSKTNLTAPTAKKALTLIAWQAVVSYVINGVPAYKGVKMASSDGAPALEIKARVHGFNVDNEAFPVFASNGQAKSALGISGGVNLYLLEATRLMLDVDYVKPKAKVGTMDPETVLTAAFQYYF